MKSLFIFYSILCSSVSFAISFSPATPPTSFASDLILPGERWLSTFKHISCLPTGRSIKDGLSENHIEKLSVLKKMDLQFEKATTDKSLDHLLVKATFKNEQQNQCRYNALFFADNAKNTYSLLQSIAFNPHQSEGNAYFECMEGKKALDLMLKGNSYVFDEHVRPHILSLIIPIESLIFPQESLSNEDKELFCDNKDQSTLAIQFQVEGKIKTPPLSPSTASSHP